MGVLGAVAVALAACDDGTGPGTNNGSVTVSDNTFSPSSITVSPGATVTWTWSGTTAQPHNVTFADPSITDGTNRSSGTFSTTMPTAAGTYAYQCTNHTGMTGSVTVS